jgi:N-acetylglucosamine kinase-like BadF-type ATPase
VGLATYVLGVDGGNTKTIALVGRSDGSVVGMGRGGCSDIYTSPDVEVPLGEADRAVSSALTMSGIEARDLAAGAFSMAGADWPEDFALLQSAMRARGYGRRIVVVNDAVGALRAGSPSGLAVVAVCGTGANTAARSANGTVWHTSWWQDAQGAHYLGTQTLQAVYRAELGIDPPTALTVAVLRHFERESVEEIVYLFSARGVGDAAYAQVGSLSKVLFDTAHNGDPTAHIIVRKHGEALGDYVLAAARRVGIEKLPFTLVLAGGVLRHSSRLMPEALIARVQAGAPGANPVYSVFEPAVGALLLAFEAAGIIVGEPLLERLTTTLPDSSLFAT